MTAIEFGRHWNLVKELKTFALWFAAKASAGKGQRRGGHGHCWGQLPTGGVTATATAPRWPCPLPRGHPGEASEDRRDTGALWVPFLGRRGALAAQPSGAPQRGSCTGLARGSLWGKPPNRTVNFGLIWSPKTSCSGSVFPSLTWSSPWHPTGPSPSPAPSTKLAGQQC